MDFRSGLVDATVKSEARSARSFASGTVGILSTHFVPWSQMQKVPSTLAASMRPTVEAAWRLRHTLSPTFPMELLVNRPEALRVLSRPEAGLWDGARVVRHHASLNLSHVVGQHFAKIHYAWRLSAFVQSSFQLTCTWTRTSWFLTRHLRTPCSAPLHLFPVWRCPWIRIAAQASKVSVGRARAAGRCPRFVAA